MCFKYCDHYIYFLSFRVLYEFCMLCVVVLQSVLCAYVVSVVYQL